MTVYADNAATTQMSDSVLKAMMPLLTDIYGNPSSLHSVGQIAKEHLEAARETVAECIGADPKEIYFTSGGSEADNQAIRSAAYIGARKGKKHIISSKFEHHAVLHTLDALKKEGFEVTLLDVYSNGIVKPEDVANAITDETCLVTIMTANNEIGTIQPIAEIGRICKEKGVLFHTDAVQAVGHIPVNVKDMNCDMLSVSAHKFHGPKGVGFLYARKGILLTNIIYGGAQERNKRAGTENMASIVGMATVLAMDTMKNAFKVAAGKMTRSDLAQEMVKELMISSAALAGGTFAQSFIGIPVVGFMIGSFIGSAIGAFAYNCGYSAVMSFCIDTGFTMFGLVKQDYTLPEDVLEYIGIDVFQYEKFLPKQFQKEGFAPLNFNRRKFEADTLEIHILRRGVIGVSEIGYV